jgi:hypothetical protein
MDQNRMKLWVLAALLAVLAMVPFILQRGNLNQLRAENARLQAQVRDLVEAQKAATNVARATARPENGSPTKDQLLELMRLRAEVTALRKVTNAAAGAIPAVAPAPVVAADPALAASEAPRPVLATNGPPWNYKGFARPDDTLSTMVWAMEQGRLDLLLSSATPEAQAQIQQEYGSPEKLKAQASEIAEIRPSPNHPPTENEVYMSMVMHRPAQQVTAEETIDIGGRTIEKGQPYTVGAQVSETLVKLQRVGNEWKFAGKAAK